MRARVAGHDVVVNCAAYTAVDAAESDEATAFAVNAVGAANLARAASAEGATLVQLSTDYVVAGTGRSRAGRRTGGTGIAYGRRKAAGEWAVRADCPPVVGRAHGLALRCRRSELPGDDSAARGEREHLPVVADQVGQPTWTMDLAEGVLRIVDAGAPFGIWHATGGGECSWYDLARAVLEELGLDPEQVVAVTTRESPPAGPAAVVQRALARHVGCRRAHPAPALARRPAPGGAHRPGRLTAAGPAAECGIGSDHARRDRSPPVLLRPAVRPGGRRAARADPPAGVDDRPAAHRRAQPPRPLVAARGGPAGRPPAHGPRL